MDIGKFIEEYDQAQSKDRLIKKHVLSDYISFEVKLSESKKIIEYSCYEDVDGRRVFRLNSPVRYMLFMMAVIRSYTDLEFDLTNTMIQFDLLDQRGIFEQLIQIIGGDVDKFQTVLNMTMDDLMANERSMVAKIADLGEAINVIIEQAAQQE